MILSSIFQPLCRSGNSNYSNSNSNDSKIAARTVEKQTNVGRAKSPGLLLFAHMCGCSTLYRQPYWAFILEIRKVNARRVIEV